VATEALQQAGVLQSLSEYARRIRKKGIMLHMLVLFSDVIIR
jgi:hypothetical protein